MPSEPSATPRTDEASSLFARLDDEIARLTLQTGAAGAMRDPVPGVAFRRILVAIQPPPSDAELAWARLLAESFGSTLTLVNVALTVSDQMFPGTHGFGLAPSPASARLAVEAPEESERLLAQTAERLRAMGVEARTMSRLGHAGEEIVRAAEETDADLVLLGGGSRALDRLVLGSTADFVKNHASCSVLIAKRAPTAGPILVGVDGSVHSRLAARAALSLSTALDRDVRMIHSVPEKWHTAYDEAVMRDTRSGDTATRLIPRVQPEMRAGDARDVLVQASKELEPTLVVLGMRGLSGIQRLFAGSVSGFVSHASPASLLLVRHR